MPAACRDFVGQALEERAGGSSATGQTIDFRTILSQVAMGTGKFRFPRLFRPGETLPTPIITSGLMGNAPSESFGPRAMEERESVDTPSSLTVDSLPNARENPDGRKTPGDATETTGPNRRVTDTLVRIPPA